VVLFVQLFSPGTKAFKNSWDFMLRSLQKFVLKFVSSSPKNFCSVLEAGVRHE